MVANLAAACHPTALYFLIFGKLIGDRIGTISGSSYSDYIVPGIIFNVGHQPLL